MGRRAQMRHARAGRATARGSLPEVWQRLGDFEAAVVVTWPPGGLPRVRPVLLEDPAALPGSDLWLLASRQAEGGEGLETGATVGLCCYGPEPGAWLSLSAVAQLDADRLTIHRLFSPDHRTLFPGGPDDPDLVVVRLALLRAELWEPIAGQLRLLYQRVGHEREETAARAEALHPG